MNKFNISVLSSGDMPYNYIFNGKILFNEIVYSRGINRMIFAIYIRKYEKLSK